MAATVIEEGTRVWEFDLDAEVPCEDKSCEHDHPPAVARLRQRFRCHVTAIPICEGCLVTWNGVIVKGAISAMVGARSLCACLVCGVGHQCCAAVHYAIIDL